MELDFGLGRVYYWVFYVADVTTPILGIDFLTASQFNINIHNASITNKSTRATIRANTTRMSNTTQVTSTITSSDYLQLLNEFSLLLSEKPIHPPRHNMVHRIRTIGGPGYCRPRHLRTHISASVKPAFAKLLADSIINE